MDRKIRLTFSGDLLCYAIQNRASADCSGIFSYDGIFERVSDYLKSSDVVCGSLETPLTDEGAELTASSKIFNTPQQFAAAARDAGFNLFTTGNNHALDRGVKGLNRTLKILDRLQIAHTGTYLSKEDADSIFIKDIDGFKIAFVSFTYGTNSRSNKEYLSESELYKVDLLREQDKPQVLKQSLLHKCIRKVRLMLHVKSATKPLAPILDSVSETEISNPKNAPYIANLLRKLKRAGESSDIVVFCMHSGGQFNFYQGVGPYTQYIMDLASSNGADIIIGNHTHCVMPSSFDGEKFKSAALGNFCFTPRDGYYIDKVYADYSILLHILIDSQKRCVSDITFSVLKSVRDSNNYSKVFGVYELYQSLDNDKERTLLISDVSEVIGRFVDKTPKKVEIKREYNYSDF